MPKARSACDHIPVPRTSRESYFALRECASTGTVESHWTATSGGPERSHVPSALWRTNRRRPGRPSCRSRVGYSHRRSDSRIGTAGPGEFFPFLFYGIGASEGLLRAFNDNGPEWPNHALRSEGRHAPSGIDRFQSSVPASPASSANPRTFPAASSAHRPPCSGRYRWLDRSSVLNRRGIEASGLCPG
jgi:hypothetical protein